MSPTPLPVTASSQELLLTNSTTLSGYLGSSSSSSFLSSSASSMETQPSPRRPFCFYFGRRRVCFAKKNKPNFIPIKKQDPLEEIAQEESVGSTQSSPPYGFFFSRKKLANSADTFSAASSATTRKRKDGGFHHSVHVAKNKLLKFDTPTETFLETKDAGQELDLTELVLYYEYEYEYEGSQELLTPTNSTTDSIYWGSSSAFSYFLSSLASSMEAQPSRPFYFGRRRVCAKKSKPDLIVIKKRDPHEESAEESAGSTES